ncbi:MAG: cupredoxin domain-containing protein [Candidatus Buchananbacteria bacterium]|nr:cupredoxin domain-containing protein [Candidatus Buchananbacteria bacterium]
MVKLKYFSVGVTALALIALVGAGCTPKGTTLNSNTNSNTNAAVNAETDDNANANTALQGGSKTMQGDVKEFTMTSFYEIVDGQPKPQFSIKEIAVKKGDKVRIKVINTKGNHDFNLDEFGISEQTPLDQEVVIEFTADKAGEFQYYCSKPGHREAGHWGTLKVTE